MRQTQNTQKKNNRRSILVIGLLLMLVAVIGFGGYTLSKYVTKKSTSANASVAKWGFTVTTEEDKLFGTKYAFGTDNSVVNENAEAAKLTVSASDAKTKLVAPGTTGSMKFTVKGTAEVLAQIKIEMTDMHDVALNYTKDATTSTYNPVLWTLKKNDQNVEGAVDVTLETLATKLNSTTVYQPNANEVNDVYTIEWKWAFNVSEENDALDTLLGMYANSTENTTNGDYSVVTNGTTNTTVSFKLAITIEQLQKAA